MNLKALMTLAISVLRDWRVIFITILFLILASLASYVVRYRKKPRKPKKAKPVPAPKPAKKKEKTEDEEDEAEEETSSK